MAFRILQLQQNMAQCFRIINRKSRAVGNQLPGFFEMLIPRTKDHRQTERESCAQCFKRATGSTFALRVGDDDQKVAVAQQERGLRPIGTLATPMRQLRIWRRLLVEPVQRQDVAAARGLPVEYGQKGRIAAGAVSVNIERQHRCCFGSQRV